MDQEIYYDRIKKFNVRHYAGEIPFYSTAPLRPVEIKVLESLSSGSKILDLGCGSGRFSIGAAQKGFEVTGLDITEAAIKAAQKRVDSNDKLNARFLVGDMTELPFASKEFDYVFCPRFSINAVATIERRRMAIREMLRVVKPTGLVFIESFNELYVGSNVLSPLKNITRDVYRYAKMTCCNILKIKYSGLLPGDITYKANKVDTATDGYAHLPTVFELRKWVPIGLNYSIFSIPQIMGRGFDIFKYMRYSMWLIIGENPCIKKRVTD